MQEMGIYRESEGDVVAAPSFREAVAWYCMETGIFPDELGDWEEITKDRWDTPFKFYDEDENQTIETTWRNLLLETQSFPALLATANL